jgi:hypothetical protein
MRVLVGKPIWLSVAVSLAVAVVGTAGPDAAATSCIFVPEAQARRGADVVLEGVVLSGPRARGVMASPARVRVAHYLKGWGPGIVDLGTGVLQVTPGDEPAFISTGPGDSFLSPGDVLRIYGQTPRGMGHSAAAGIIEPDLCDLTGRISARGILKYRPSSAVSAPDPRGGRRWRARLLLGPRHTWCIRFGRGRHQGNGECVPMRHRHRLLLGVGTEGMKEQASSSIVVAGRGLQRVEVSSPDGTRSVRARGSGRIALLPLSGYIDPDEVMVRGLFRDGAETVINSAAHRALADDPAGGTPWKAVIERAHPHRQKGLFCVRWRQTVSRSGFTGESPVQPGECGNLARDQAFFAVRRVLEYDENARRTVTMQNVLFGAVSREVTEVKVTGPDGERVLEPSPRGAFIAAYPPAVTYLDLSLEFRFRDGSVASYSGRHYAAISTPRKAPLSNRWE